MKSRGFVLAVLDFVLAVVAAGLVGCGDDNPIGPQLGTVEVKVTMAGQSFDADRFVVSLDDGAQTEDLVARIYDFFASGSVTLEVEAGDHTVELTDIAANCTVAGDNPVSVTVTTGETSTASFALTCVAIIPPRT